MAALLWRFASIVRSADGCVLLNKQQILLAIPGVDVGYVCSINLERKSIDSSRLRLGTTHLNLNMPSRSMSEQTRR
jgi:hypothetical protein